MGILCCRYMASMKQVDYVANREKTFTLHRSSRARLMHLAPCALCLLYSPFAFCPQPCAFSLAFCLLPIFSAFRMALRKPRFMGANTCTERWALKIRRYMEEKE